MRKNKDDGIERYAVEPGQTVLLAERETRYTGDLDKKKAKKRLKALQDEILDLQEKLHADGTRSVLIVLQSMDAGGKDSAVRRVFGPLNPNWCRVASFKKPTAEELSHDFLWRIHMKVPPAGYIGIFNRSQYEDVIVAQVKGLVPAARVETRYDHINRFERLLHDEGTAVVKFYLHISKEYQKKRLERRLRLPEKHWKFDPSDLKERERWDRYMSSIETALSRCSTSYAPWYVIPGERRWYRDVVIAAVVRNILRDMQLSYPGLPEGTDPDSVTIPD